MIIANAHNFCFFSKCAQMTLNKILYNSGVNKLDTLMNLLEVNYKDTRAMLFDVLLMSLFLTVNRVR